MPLHRLSLAFFFAVVLLPAFFLGATRAPAQEPAPTDPVPKKNPPTSPAVPASSTADSAPGRISTADGVYTLAQATRGKDVFALACQACHSPTVHAGPPFRNAWFGRTLGELFGYLRREMPKADPGTMTNEDYALVTAYLLRINGMPTGRTPLAADSAALHRIILDSVPTTTEERP